MLVSGHEVGQGKFEDSGWTAVIVDEESSWMDAVRNTLVEMNNE